MMATTSPVIIMTQDELNALIRSAADAAVERARACLPQGNAIRPASVSQAEAARMLKLSRPTIGKMVRFGTFKLNRLGQIPIEQIDRALKET